MTGEQYNNLTPDARSLMCIILKRHGKNSDHFKIFTRTVSGRSCTLPLLYNIELLLAKRGKQLQRGT